MHPIVIGVLCVAIALVVARRRSSARWLYVPLAAWLFAAGAVIPYERHFAIWNNVAIGFALLLVPLTTTTLALLRPGRG